MKPCLESNRKTVLAALAAAALIFGDAAAATEVAPSPSVRLQPPPVLDTLRLDPALEARILALDPKRITDKDVRDTLSQVPAPRIFLLHGGVFPVHLIMWSFARYLNQMGYPEVSLRDPATGDWSYTPYDTTEHLAGLIAWSYEHEGMRPMIVGHSQGGLFAVKILKELDGQLGKRATVYDPTRKEFEDRATIIDPLTGRERSITGLSVSYVAVIGAGGWALALPAWWESLDTLRKIPDTVSEFTGFFVEGDVIALSFRGNPLDTPYEATGSAAVRNVYLPPDYNHITVPDTEDLPADPVARAWIEAYAPDAIPDMSGLSPHAQEHALWAADTWYSIKKHWALEAQRLVRARQAAAAGVKSAASDESSPSANTKPAATSISPPATPPAATRGPADANPTPGG